MQPNPVVWAYAAKPFAWATPIEIVQKINDPNGSAFMYGVTQFIPVPVEPNLRRHEQHFQPGDAQVDKILRER